MIYVNTLLLMVYIIKILISILIVMHIYLTHLFTANQEFSRNISKDLEYKIESC